MQVQNSYSLLARADESGLVETPTLLLQNMLAKVSVRVRVTLTLNPNPNPNPSPNPNPDQGARVARLREH